MTYNVLSGTLNTNQPMNLLIILQCSQDTYLSVLLPVLTTAHLKPDLSLTYFPPSRPHSASDLFSRNYILFVLYCTVAFGLKYEDTVSFGSVTCSIQYMVMTSKLFLAKITTPDI